MKWKTAKFAAMLCVGMMLSPGSALAGEAGEAEILSVTAITETQEEGEKFVALAIQYEDEIQSGVATRSSYTVAGREVTRVYVNDTGKTGDVAYTGNYVIVELATSNVPGASLGTTLYFGKMNDMEVKINHRLPVEALITQTEDLVTVSGDVAYGKRLDITGEANLLADQFTSGTFVDPESGFELNYRLYIPEGYEEMDETMEKLPLVLFLHGSGERGYNNQSQLLANPSALEFAREKAQEVHPCFVLAPQNPVVTEAWTKDIGTEEVPDYAITPQLQAAKHLVDEVIKNYNVDSSRIYGSGLSQGSKGIARLSMDYPELFAAQINSSGVDKYYSSEDVAAIAGKSIWFLNAVDDPTNPSEDVRTLVAQLEEAGAVTVQNKEDRGWNGWLRGEDAAALALGEWDEAKAAGAEILYTEYIAGTVVPNAHWSWMANFSNASVREWLFSHTNPNPYTVD